ncbi:MAG: tRNA pseudouridine synthase A [Planctomycetota bacterium]
MPRYRLTIAYDGTDFSGWQKQEPVDPNAPPDPETGEPARMKLRTVQEIVERAVREVVREPVNLMGASRTDAGVHAWSQCGAFTCSDGAPQGRGWPEDRGTESLRRAINGRLPPDVIVRTAEVVPESFDPIKSCMSKGYSYTIHAGRDRPVFDRQFVHHVWEQLDATAMTIAARHFEGEHDFNAFAAAGHGRTSTVRTIYGCSVTTLPSADGGSDTSDAEFPAQRVRIDVSGNGFLYNMVRIIAGTLYEVGRGKIEPGSIPSIIESLDRRQAGMTLPATGLRLEWIEYPDRRL